MIPQKQEAGRKTDHAALVTAKDKVCQFDGDDRDHFNSTR